MATGPVGWITHSELVESIKYSTAGCWIWQRHKDTKGYGTLGRHRKIWKAHRISYFMFHADASLDVLTNKTLFVCHKCDKPACINPEHLFLGTSRDNVYDSIKKGRWPVGVNKTQAKLTADDVRTIRKLRLEGVPVKNMVLQFKVTKRVIYDIFLGKKYKSVN